MTERSLPKQPVLPSAGWNLYDSFLSHSWLAGQLDIMFKKFEIVAGLFCYVLYCIFMHTLIPYQSYRIGLITLVLAVE